MPDQAPTGTRLELPAGAAPPYHVYVNGQEQAEGVDYDVLGRELAFRRPLVTTRRPEGLWKKFVMSTAGIGFYPKADSVDIHYTDADGSPGVASGLSVRPGT
jgi:hypothetical protein